MCLKDREENGWSWHFLRLGSVKSCKNRLHMPLDGAGRQPRRYWGERRSRGRWDRAHHRATGDEASLLTRPLQDVLNYVFLDGDQRSAFL